MPEVYHFLECEIKRVGSVVGGTTEYSIDAYAENVSVTMGREFVEMKDTSGVVQKRVPVGSTCEMTIGKLYQADVSLCDGNAIKLYMGNALGTETWQMLGAYWANKDFGGDELIAYNVSITGKSFGTI